MDTRIPDLLCRLVLAAGVSGNETAVAAVVRSEIAAAGIDPAGIQTDRMGNLWLHLGPDGEPQRLLAAHMDEIGLRITSIRDDGICRVAAIGGIDAQLWEGTPVVVHSAGGPVEGCIAPVSHHVTFRTSLGPKGRLQIEDLLLDVGADSPSAVAALGIRLLDTVTWPKRLVDVGGGCVQGRSLDDRFGCCAQLAALPKLVANPPKLPTVLAWTVQEEVGLRGARLLAGRFPHIVEVIAVDSFTVGTGPRDNRQFDSARLGGGPVLRAWDGTTLVPDAERNALLEKAAGSGITLQYGHMPGGNDASVFEATGARCFGFAVPLQYSHSQVERIHLGDLEQLSKLLAWWCSTAIELEG
jgi:putative aminopeptidase FrvX